MAAGIGTLCTEVCNSVVEGFLKLRTGHTGLNCDGLVGFIEADNLVEAHSHIEGNAAFNRLNAPCYRRAAAVNIKRNVVFRAIGNNFFNLLRCVRINDNIRKRVNSALAQAKKVIGSLTVCNGKAVIVRC